MPKGGDMPIVYENMLFATDLGPQSLYIGQQALALSQLCGAKLSVIHVIEPPVTYTTEFAKHDTQLEQAKLKAKDSLQALGNQLTILQQNQMLEVGIPQEEILAASIHHHCDLIIVGSHGIGGYTHLLGSTAHHLLENAPCNVLIVQVSQLEKMIQKTLPKEAFLWQQPQLYDILKKGQKPPQYGSIHGFGEVVRRGPHPSKRPGNIPYKGGTRTRTSEESNDNNDENS